MAILTNAHQCVLTAASVTRKIISGFTVVALLLGLATSAYAQQSGGTIRGSVAGADSSTTVEVVDTGRGITKSEGTDSSGSFRFDGLAPGSYEVRVLQGGSQVDSHTVNVRLGVTSTVSMATTAEAIEEIVTTGTRQAAIDMSIAESGLVIDAQQLLELPVQRDMASVAMLAPGTSRGDYRFGTSGNVAFAGASIAENTSFINGLNTTNFRTGVGFSQVPFEFYETLQIKTGGYSAKYGRSLGGVMNAKTKSGSNDWDFGANVYYTTEVNQATDTYIGANNLDEDDDTTIDVFASGPIWKDHLFFYALYSDADDTARYAGYRSNTDIDYQVAEGFWGVKIDAYITDNHHLEYTAFSDERSGIEATYDFSAGVRGVYLGDTTYEEGGDNWIATYTGDFGDNFQLSVSVGENEQARTTSPATAHLPYVNEYTAAGGFNYVGLAAGPWISDGLDNREMTRVDLRFQVGSHDLSAGIDSESNFATEATEFSGGAYWVRDPNNELLSTPCTAAECPQGAVARLRTYSIGGGFETNSDSWYIQDVWEVSDKWTLELGLRNETFENLNSDGDVFVEVTDQLAPRISAVWDPKGDGTSKVFMNYGLYYLPIAANTNIRMSGGETYIHDYYDWDGVSIDPATQGPIGLGAVFAQDVFGNGEVPDTRSTTDVNLDAMYQSEIILGYTRYLDSGIELGIKGIYRNLETTIEDVAIDAAVISYYNGNGTWDDTLVGGDTVEDVFSGFHQYVLTNPGVDMNVYITEMDEFIDLTAAQLNYPEAERQYGAVEVLLARPFDGQWGLDGSYTWSHNWGNHEGYVKSDNGQDDAGITQNFDQPGLTDHSYGNLPNDRRHTVKMRGTYQLDNGIRFGANFMWQSGRPRSCFGEHPTDVFAQDYGESSHFCEDEDGNSLPVKRGSLGTTPDVMTVDLSAQYNWDMGGANVLLAFDIFNAFNSSNPLVYNEDGDTSDYQKIRRYQEPLTMRLSARLRF